MNGDLRISVHFLQPYSHGRGEDGYPEWPPSPLRLFQALVASSVGREVDDDRRARAIAALRWLEELPAPEIIVPGGEALVEGYRSYVPDNVDDAVGRAWSKRNDGTLGSSRSEKDVRAIGLDDGPVHFVYRSVEGLGGHLETLRAAARSMTHLGWGIDMVAGDAGDEPIVAGGARWVPGKFGGTRLRAPTSGTFDALERKHAQFLSRLDGTSFRPVSPLSAYRVESYGLSTDRAPRPFVAYRLLDPDTGDRLALDPAKRTRDVAAWVRHAVSEVCEGWPFGDTRTFVHGHGDVAESARGSFSRLSYLPLPTLNPRLERVENVARVLLVAPPGCDDRVEWIDARLRGEELTWMNEPRATLEPIRSDDWVTSQYVSACREWASVTPVVLPGHDDRSGRKAERLLIKAFEQAGIEPATVSEIQDFEWRKVGYFEGTELAHRYLTPDKVVGPMFHVRVRFARPLRGPLAIGSGRHRGMGLFAPLPFGRSRAS